MKRHENTRRYVEIWSHGKNLDGERHHAISVSVHEDRLDGEMLRRTEYDYVTGSQLKRMQSVLRSVNGNTADNVKLSWWIGAGGGCGEAVIEGRLD